MKSKTASLFVLLSFLQIAEAQNHASFPNGITIGAFPELTLYSDYYSASGQSTTTMQSNNGGVSVYAPHAETVRSLWDGGIALYGTPVSVILCAEADALYQGTFDVWRSDDYFSGQAGSLPAFRIDTAANVASCNGLNFVVNNGNLAVGGSITSSSGSVLTESSALAARFIQATPSGMINLVGPSTGVLSNGATIFSLNSSGKVDFASNRMISIASTTQSTGSTTGALTVSGGIGIAKDSFVNGIRIGRGGGEHATNTVIGNGALSAANVGYHQTALGTSALAANTTGHSNTAVGSYALPANTAGFNNTALGTGSLGSNIGGSHNTALGSKAMNLGTNSYYNTAVGVNALYNNTGNGNTTTGVRGLFYNTSGSNNASMGSNSLEGNTTGSDNIGVGVLTGRGNATGNFNVFIGSQAGRFQANGANEVTSVNNSVFIGANTKGSGDGEFNSIVIGSGATGLGSNTTVLGTPETSRTRLFGTLEVSAIKAPATSQQLIIKGQVVIEQPQGDISMGIYN